MHVHSVNVVDIDDWARRRNHRYGSIVYDLERRWNVGILPEREIVTVRAWLADHSEIGVVSQEKSSNMGQSPRFNAD